MQRRNYKRSSGVVLDICHEHGSWLDADELEQIAGFILAGGHTSAMLEAEHQAAKAEAAVAAVAATAAARMRASSRRSLGADDLVDLARSGGSLLRLFTRLLS
jgi:hypothetical protein